MKLSLSHWYPGSRVSIPDLVSQSVVSIPDLCPLSYFGYEVKGVDTF